MKKAFVDRVGKGIRGSEFLERNSGDFVYYQLNGCVHLFVMYMNQIG